MKVKFLLKESNEIDDLVSILDKIIETDEAPKVFHIEKYLNSIPLEQKDITNRVEYNLWRNHGLKYNKGRFYNNKLKITYLFDRLYSITYRQRVKVFTSKDKKIVEIYYYDEPRLTWSSLTGILFDYNIDSKLRSKEWHIKGVLKNENGPAVIHFDDDGNIESKVFFVSQYGRSRVVQEEEYWEIMKKKKNLRN